MTRDDFINALYNNDDGLTLNQIEQIEEMLIYTIPDGMIDDIKKACIDDPLTHKQAVEAAMMTARDTFIMGMHDCEDMLELRDYFIEYAKIDVTDHQVYKMYYIR